jgi:hypothetical protein
VVELLNTMKGPKVELRVIMMVDTYLCGQFATYGIYISEKAGIQFNGLFSIVPTSHIRSLSPRMLYAILSV